MGNQRGKLCIENNWSTLIIFLKEGYMQCIKMSFGTNTSQNSPYLQKKRYIIFFKTWTISIKVATFCDDECAGHVGIVWPTFRPPLKSKD